MINLFSVYSIETIIEGMAWATSGKRIDWQEYSYWKNQFYKSFSWQELRKKFLNEGASCVDCGIKEHLDLHHKIPLVVCPLLALDKENLELKCRNCHRQWHKENDKKSKLR